MKCQHLENTKYQFEMLWTKRRLKQKNLMNHINNVRCSRILTNNKIKGQITSDSQNEMIRCVID